MVFFSPDHTHGMNPMFGVVTPNPIQHEPISAAAHMPLGMPLLHGPLASSAPVGMPAPRQHYLAEHLDPEQTVSSVQSKSKASRSKAQKQKVVQQSKKTETPSTCKGDDFLKNLVEDKRETLCAYIYELMTAKGLTSPAGYLVVDVISNVWRDMFT